jgi:hypothetical protein
MYSRGNRGKTGMMFQPNKLYEMVEGKQRKDTISKRRLIEGESLGIALEEET